MELGCRDVGSTVESEGTARDTITLFQSGHSGAWFDHTPDSFVSVLSPVEGAVLKHMHVGGTNATSRSLHLHLTVARFPELDLDYLHAS